jgi:hypothetical protein
VRFFQVSEDELENLRERFAAGQYDISIESKTFSMADYTAMITGEMRVGVGLCLMGTNALAVSCAGTMMRAACAAAGCTPLLMTIEMLLVSTARGLGLGSKT